MTAEAELAGIQQEFREFIAAFASAQLATVNAERWPEASYAPLLQHEQKFYIYVSELAAHTQNLLARPQASLLFIEDERQARNVFARQRAVLQVSATEISRDSGHWQQILQRMEDRFGSTMELLRSLPDFHLFALTPLSGSYVKGFGKAYRLQGEDLAQITHQQRA